MADHTPFPLARSAVQLHFSSTHNYSKVNHHVSSYNRLDHPATTTTLVVFDARVTDLELLYNTLLPGSIGRTISQTDDAIDVITNLLGETGAIKLAIVAHGQASSIQIGRESIDRAMLKSRSGLLQEWGVTEIALYSCEVGADQEFIRQFSQLTGAWN
jgi:Domain of unknown function (DUF4347)